MALSFSPSSIPILIGISTEEEGVATHTSIQGTPHRLLSLVNEDWSLSELIIRNKIGGLTRVVDSNKGCRQWNPSLRLF